MINITPFFFSHALLSWCLIFSPKTGRIPNHCTPNLKLFRLSQILPSTNPGLAFRKCLMIINSVLSLEEKKIP